METTLCEAPNFKGILRLKENKSSSQSGYLQYVEVKKDRSGKVMSEKVVYESRELYTAYCEGTADILCAVEEFYNSDKTKAWLAKVQIEDKLRGLNNYERIIQGLLEFCLNA